MVRERHNIRYSLLMWGGIALATVTAGLLLAACNNTAPTTITMLLRRAF
jgi:hypothetical protein